MLRSLLIASALVTVAVTGAMANDPAPQAPGTWFIVATAWPVGQEQARHEFAYNRAMFASKQECEQALATPSIAAEIGGLKVALEAGIGAAVGMTVECQTRSTPA